jgi:outer membrane biosynthesis protein TonB
MSSRQIALDLLDLDNPNPTREQINAACEKSILDIHVRGLNTVQTRAQILVIKNAAAHLQSQASKLVTRHIRAKDPEMEPTPEPTPEPAPEPTPDPTSDPTPESAPDPTPCDVSECTPKPDPATMPTLESTTPAIAERRPWGAHQMAQKLVL